MRKREASISLVSALSGSRDSLLCRRQQCASVRQGCVGSTGVYRARRAHKVVHAYLGGLISSISFVVGGLKYGLRREPNGWSEVGLSHSSDEARQHKRAERRGQQMVDSATGHMRGTRGREACQRKMRE